MRWLALVVVPPDGNASSHVFRIMEPYCEARCDYFGIGGRDYRGWFGGEGPRVSELDPDCRVVAVECVF